MTEKESNIGFPQAIDQTLADELAANTSSRARVLELIDQGADVNAVDGFGESMLMHSVSQVVMGETDSLQFIELLMKKGADVNYKTPDENHTALCSSIFSSKPELMRLLLKHGANPNVIGDGESTLEVAEFDLWFEQIEATRLGEHHLECVESLKEMVALLKQHGAKSTAEIRAKTGAETL